MRKRSILTLLVIVLLLGSTYAIAHAQGQYDGIWYSPGYNDYMTVNECNGKLIVVDLDPSGTYTAYLGTLQGNYVSLHSIYSLYVDIVVDVTFTLPTTGTATQVSCRPSCPSCYCTAPNGATFQLKKIW